MDWIWEKNTQHSYTTEHQSILIVEQSSSSVGTMGVETANIVLVVIIVIIFFMVSTIIGFLHEYFVHEFSVSFFKIHHSSSVLAVAN